MSSSPSDLLPEQLYAPLLGHEEADLRRACLVACLDDQHTRLVIEAFDDWRSRWVYRTHLADYTDTAPCGVAAAGGDAGGRFDRGLTILGGFVASLAFVVRNDPARRGGPGRMGLEQMPGEGRLEGVSGDRDRLLPADPLAVAAGLARTCYGFATGVEVPPDSVAVEVFWQIARPLVDGWVRAGEPREAALVRAERLVDLVADQEGEACPPGEPEARGPEPAVARRVIIEELTALGPQYAKAVTRIGRVLNRVEARYGKQAVCDLVESLAPLALPAVDLLFAGEFAANYQLPHLADLPELAQGGAESAVDEPPYDLGRGEDLD
jgi:hypothetical protein